MISILLATYNGEKYISEQIESLFTQTFQEFKLYINDDNSSDGTFSIIEAYQAKNPDKIFAVKNDKNSGSAKFNFIEMMINYKDDYVMLCDQDDVWLPEKIENTLSKMRAMESEYGSNTPILVHTDLRVVNEHLDTISPSFKSAMNADYGKTSLRNQIVQNTLTGCTVMYNRALSNLITNIPSFMVMHDWWLMLVASAFGKVSALDEQTILYRQHEVNEIGAKDVRRLSYILNKLCNYGTIKKALSETYSQAQSLLNVYRSKLSLEQIELLTTYCSIPSHNKLMRWHTICKLGTMKNGFTRKVAHFIFV